MNKESDGSDQDVGKSLRLRTSRAMNTFDESATNGASEDARAGEKKAKAAHHKAEFVVVLAILLLFVLGGIGLYLVVNYSPSVQDSGNGSGSEVLARSARVQGGTAVRESEQQSSVEVIIGTSEQPVLTVFESPIGAPPASIEVDVQGDQVVDVNSPDWQAPEVSRNADYSEAIGKYIAARFIGSVRLGETDPRVILDGRSYSRGDRIEGPYEIRFIAAREGVLYFEDNSGIIYRRRF
jgi:hypothetical protein